MYDIIIRGGVIVDGSGSPPFKSDIGIKDGIIAKIKDLSNEKAEMIIDAKGLYISPGFIDIHNHSDISIIDLPTADNYVLQGVTTLVIGNCGSSPAPLTDLNKKEFEKIVKKDYPEIEVKWKSFREYLDVVREKRPVINIAPLVGHGTLRSAVIGYENRKASEKELEEMKRLLEESLREGAFGMSTGLIYVPSMFGDTNELIELMKTAAKYDGIYATHMRNEGVGLIDSVIEAIRIGVEAGVSVEISHLKASGRPAWGKVDTALQLIKEYSSRGYDVSADAYPYTASSTSLVTLLPREFREGSREDILKRLRQPGALEILRERLGEALLEERYLSWSDIMISYSPSHKDLEGLRIDKIAEKLGLDPVETIVRLLIDDEIATGMILFGMNEEDVDKVISSPLVAIGSDGSVGRFGVGKPHPRRYGTFPRIIARYVREKKLLSLQEAVRKMTSLPARKLRLWDRGLIRPGFKADLVVFDFYKIEDTATYENPHSYPRGIKYVIINGRIVAENGRIVLREGSGEILRREM